MTLLVVVRMRMWEESRDLIRKTSHAFTGHISRRYIVINIVTPCPAPVGSSPSPPPPYGSCDFGLLFLHPSPSTLLAPTVICTDPRPHRIPPPRQQARGNCPMSFFARVPRSNDRRESVLSAYASRAETTQHHLIMMVIKSNSHWHWTLTKGHP